MHDTRKTLYSVALIACLPTFGGVAIAGSVITMEARDLTAEPSPPATVQISIDGAALRIDATGDPADESGSLLFHSDAGEMTAIDHSRKQYVVMDEAAFEDVAGQIDDAMQEMREALAQLPPEQRAMAERMMKQRMGSMGPGAGAPTARPRAIEKTGGSDSVNGYPCETYAMIEDGRTTRDMCVTSWSNIEGGDAYARVMGKMAGFFENMRRTFSRGGMDLMGSGSDVFTHMRDIDGFPVRSRSYDGNGAVVEETTLVSSESRDLDPVVFAPPAGYTEQTIPR